MHATQLRSCAERCWRIELYRHRYINPEHGHLLQLSEYEYELHILD